MKKRWWFAIAIILLFIILVKAEPVSAAPKPIVSPESNLFIELVIPDTHIANTDYKVHLHLYNLSTPTNSLLTNESANCYLHLYNLTNGGHLVEDEFGFDSNLVDFDYTVQGGNFTNGGKYQFIVWCNTSQLYDVEGGYMQVNTTGQTLDTSDALIYVMMMVFFATLIFIIIKLIGIIPDQNPTDELGNLVGVQNLKHLRPILWGIVWVLVLGCAFILSNIGLTYLPDTMMGDIFFFVFRFMMIISVPMLIIWSIYLLVNIFRDREINKLIYQGFELDGNGNKKL